MRGGHRRHKEFFSPADKTNNPGSGIPKNAGQSVLRGEPRKAIKVPESFMFSHEKFISLFFDPIQARKPAKIKGGLVFWGQFLPTRFAEDPKNIHKD